MAQLRASTTARGATATFALRVYGAGLAYLPPIVLARSIGAEQLGIFVFAWSWLTIVAFLTPLGFDTSLVRFVSSYRANADAPGIRGVLSTGFCTTLLSSIATAAVGVGIALAIDPAGDSAYTVPLVIALATIPVVAMINLLQGVARGFAWIALVAAPGFAIRPTIFLLLAGGCIAVLHRTDGASITAAFAVASVATLGVQLIACRRRLPRDVREARPEFRRREWIGASVPMMLVASFELMLTYTDILMMGLIRGPAETGVYNAAVRTAACLLFVFFAVSAFAAPRIAELFATGQRDALVAFVRRVRGWMLGPTLGLALVLVIAGPFLLALFGDEFGPAFAPMIVLSFAAVFRAAAGPVDNLLTMTGKERQLAAALGGAALLNVAANAILLPRFGAVGAAAATSGCIAIELCAVSVLAGRHIGFLPFALRGTRPAIAPDPYPR